MTPPPKKKKAYKISLKNYREFNNNPYDLKRLDTELI